MKLSIGEIEVSYELTGYEKKEYYKFVEEAEMAEKCLKLELQKHLESLRKSEPHLIESSLMDIIQQYS